MFLGRVLLLPVLAQQRQQPRRVQGHLAQVGGFKTLARAQGNRQPLPWRQVKDQL
ncbi:hypothetical protein D3C72_2291180 [compost metagenome]